MSEFETGTRGAGGAIVPARPAASERPRWRSASVLVSLLIAAMAAAGCGSDQKKPAPPPRGPASSPFASPIPPGSSHTLSTEAARSVPLGLRQEAFYTRFGTPALPPAATGANRACAYYYAAGYIPTDLLWQVCFRNGRLETVGSAIHAASLSGGTLVLNPVPPPGRPPRKAKRPGVRPAK